MDFDPFLKARKGPLRSGAETHLVRPDPLSGQWGGPQQALKEENGRLKQLVAEYALETMGLKRSLVRGS